jgi:hypothetical protein
VNTARKGNNAELDAWEWIEQGHWPYGDGWLVGTRRKGRREKGPGDHLAYKYGHRGVLAEVKESGRGPYQDFRPEERGQVRDLAIRYNLDAALIWRPRPSADFELIVSSQWPEQQRKAA